MENNRVRNLLLPGHDQIYNQPGHSCFLSVIGANDRQSDNVMVGFTRFLSKMGLRNWNSFYNFVLAKANSGRNLMSSWPGKFSDGKSLRVKSCNIAPLV
jgi:hypothetical protein